jgi:tRNA pseudouridine38-40 synthase
MARTYKLLLSYDGTDFHGWQRQPRKRTVQGVVEKTLTKIIQKKIPVVGSGRTDAGVHALGQVAHFRASLNLTQDELFRALNSLLPPDIRMISIDISESDFHARRMARSKVYQYRIFNTPLLSPFLFRYVHHWTSPLDVPSMRKAAPLFLGEHDFSGFSSNRFLHPVRTILSAEMTKKGPEILFTVEANGFLRYMVRTMVGTLLEIGKGKMAPERIGEVFSKKNRALAGPTAPAKGLCLIKVNY